MQGVTDRQRWTVWAALGFVALTLAGTLLSTRVAVASLPPLFTQAMRFSIGGSFLVLVLVLRDARIFQTLQWRSVGVVAILAFLQVFCGQGALSAAEQSVGAGRAGLLMAAIPLWIAVFQGIFFHELLSRKAIFGLAIGFVGLLPIVLKGSTSGTLSGTLLLLFSGACWAMGTILWARLRRDESLLAMTALQLIIGGAMLLAASCAFGEMHAAAMSERIRHAIVPIAYLVSVGSAIVYPIYIWLVNAASPAVAGSNAYLTPIAALALGAVLLGEPITPLIFVSAAVTLGGVLLIVSPRATPRTHIRLQETTSTS